MKLPVSSRVAVSRIIALTVVAIVTDFDRKPFETAMAELYARSAARSGDRRPYRTHPQGKVSWPW
jgi:hypothetical protein